MTDPQFDIYFDLWPKGDFNELDVHELEVVFSNFYKVKGQVSHDLRGIDVQTVLEFVSLAIASGFSRSSAKKHIGH